VRRPRATPAGASAARSRCAGRRATIAGAQAPVPGFVFRLAGPVEGHHDVARFTWELVPAGTPADDEAPVVGFDVMSADHGGRVRTAVGFLDRVPAA
jgi:hypothetical protein